MTSTDQPTSPDSSPASRSVDSPTAVNRRHLLRGGAVAAGAAVIGAAALPSASAADNGPTVLGVANASTLATGITINAATGNTARSALQLTNANGPSLALNALPDDWDGTLQTGQIANTTLGPLIGVDGGGSPVTTYLATGIDLDNLPLPVPLNPPQRMLDTRNTAGRTGILRNSGSALDSSGRLKAGSWIDVAIAEADGPTSVDAAFLNATSTGSLTGGYLALYPPGTRPVGSTVSFSKGISTANGAFAGVGYFGGAFVVRVYASATSHVILDLTGATIVGVPGPDATVALRAKASKSRRTRPSMQRGARSLSRVGR